VCSSDLKKKNGATKKIGDNTNPYEFEITQFEKKCRKKLAKSAPQAAKKVDSNDDLKKSASDVDSDTEIDIEEFSKINGLDASSVSSKSITSRRKAMLESLESIRSVEEQISEAKTESINHTKAEKQKRQKLLEKLEKRKGFVIKHIPHQREIDEENMAAARETFIQANLERHIRQGNKNDVAYLAPTLIPVPGAFRGDGKDLSISHVAEQTFDKIQQNMIIGNIGYTPQQLLPLYVRNTLIEKNGTTPGGDQVQEVMALDRRYSHYMGRPLNRFEPSLEMPLAVNSLGLPTIKKPVITKDMKAVQKATEKRLKAMKYNPMTNSLVRMVFKKRICDDNDIKFKDY
jgi:hypothetical protein